MGLISGLLGLPMAPLRFSRWVVEKVTDEAESQYYNPEAIRREIVRADAAHADGQLTDQQRDEIQRQLLDRLFVARDRAGRR